MIKRFSAATMAVALLAFGGASAVAAPKPKPLGYEYGQCVKKTGCSYQGSTNPKQSRIALSSSVLCPTGNAGLARIGFVPVKRGGKFSIKKTVSFENLDYEKATVQVQFSGTLKPGKKAVGTLKITTTATDCAADSGVQKSFSLKYEGPYYGG